MLCIKFLFWKWSSWQSPIQSKLCGWAHHHDVWLCPLSKSRQSLLSTFILPKLKVFSYKPFPGLSDNDLTPILLFPPLIPLKINPLQNCPAHAIIHRGRVFFFLLASKWSPITPKSCVCHITSLRWRYGWERLRKKEPEGLETSYLIRQRIC